MDELEDILKAMKIVEVPDVSRQRQGLQLHAYSEEGKNEPLVARLSARIKPTTRAATQALHTRWSLWLPVA